MKFVEKFWDAVDLAVESLQLPWTSVVLYNDSFILSPNNQSWMTGVINSQANKGSRHWQLVLRLVEIGARLEKTEHHKLLGIKSWSVPRELTKTESFLRDPSTPSYKKNELKKKILLLRDRYIAHRINMTLGDKESGLLLLGAAHRDFICFLSHNIEVKNVLSQEDYRKFLLYVYEKNF
ncbi:MAG: hypothetical protein HYX21_02830 [Candidatus Yanofskybacteria bacterium]|nr:hypothetical protein [Candidatus Yanofskybacteria bacterium]